MAWRILMACSWCKVKAAVVLWLLLSAPLLEAPSGLPSNMVRQQSGCPTSSSGQSKGMPIQALPLECPGLVLPLQIPLCSLHAFPGPGLLYLRQCKLPTQRGVHSQHRKWQRPQLRPQLEDGRRCQAHAHAQSPLLPHQAPCLPSNLNLQRQYCTLFCRWSLPTSSPACSQHHRPWGLAPPLSRWTAWALSAATTLALQRLLQLSWQRARTLRIMGHREEPPLGLPLVQAQEPEQPVQEAPPQTPVRRASASWQPSTPVAMHHDAYTQTMRSAATDQGMHYGPPAAIPPLPQHRIIKHEASTSIDVNLLLPLPSGNREAPTFWTTRELGRQFGSEGIQFLAQQLSISYQSAQDLYVEACIKSEGARICHTA